MLARKFEKRLERFYQDAGKHALLVTGARQVGKTFSVERFAESHYESYLKVNFLDDPGCVRIFREGMGHKDVLERLEMLADGRLKRGRSLIFLDEIQACPEALTMIKFLVQEGSYHYILSGSLLGVELKGVNSFPVGYMHEERMFPLDFEEFLLAMGQGARVVEIVKEAYSEERPLDSFLHERLMRYFKLYLVVGGMPEAVMAYGKSSDLAEVLEIQQSICRNYRLDISKYDKQNALRIREIFDAIPAQLNKENKRFAIGSVEKSSHFSRVENGFLWLGGAGVAIPSYCVDAPAIPLKLSERRNLFKLFLSDVGLLASQYTHRLRLEILNGEKSVNFGGIYENFVAQELLAHGLKPNYYHSKRFGELDFVVEDKAGILPLAVKSGKDYKRHVALQNVLGIREYGIERALVLSGSNLSRQGRILYLPIYMAMLLRDETPESFIYKV